MSNPAPSILKRILSPLLIILLLVNLTACSEPEEPPVSQWSTEKLVAKGQQEFKSENYNTAVKYLREAAKRDDKEALYALGYMYYYGYGVAQDYDMAQDLIRRSAAFGHRPAIKALRLFVATKSQFTVDTKTPTYLADSKASTPIRESNNTNIKTNLNNSVDTKISTIKKNDSINQTPKSTTPSKPSTTISKITRDSIKNNIKSTNDIKPVAKPKTTEKNHFSNLNSNSSGNNTVIARAEDFLQEDLPVFEEDKDKTNNKINKQASTLRSIPNKNDSAKKAEQPVKSAETVANIIDKHTENSLSKQRKEAIAINQAWLKKQSPNSYTIQLTARKDLKELEQFVYINNLQSKVNIFSYLYKNEIWYGAGMGVYKKPSEAYQAMLDEVPNELKARKPWVRQFKNIHDVEQS